MNDIDSLNKLWDYINKITKENFPSNDLMPILGSGQQNKPKFMIVFINPTQRNISSDPKWVGRRFPFIGRKRPWIEFDKAGLIKSKEIIDYILNNESNWSIEFTNKMENYLSNNNLYLTNIVKNTSKDATLPNAKLINLYLPSFLKEIELINPGYILTFGLIPFNALVKEKIKLTQYYKEVVRGGKIRFFEIKINNKRYKIIPCLYPIGRGNPKKAIELLKIINKL